MPFTIRKLAQFTSAFTLSLATMQTAMADDTDLYISLSSDNPNVKPNLLFVIDSSGSMNTVDVPVETLECTTSEGTTIQQDFDADVDYSGSFDRDRIYFFNTNDGPDSGNMSPEGSFTFSDNRCDALISPLETIGFKLTEQLISYQTNRWRKIQTGDRSGRLVECRADEGVHGQNAGDGSPYARKGKNKTLWTSSSGSKVKSNTYSNNYQLYSGNRLNYEEILNSGGLTTTIPGTETCEVVTVDQSRIDVVKSVANSLVDSVTGLNIGVMTFNGSFGGFVRQELIDVDDDGSDGTPNREALQTVIQNIVASGNTPLGETLFEGVRYLRGDTPFYGAGLSTPSSLTADGSTYISPIEDSCQATNHIIFLSDGQPTADYAQNNFIESYLNTNATDTNNSYDCPPQSSTVPSGGPAGNSCLIDVAEYAANNDLSPLEEDQRARLYTIGFTEDIPILQQAATAGNGEYFQSNSVASLTEAFQQITLAALSEGTTFLSPAVSVNAFNRLQHNDEIYYALFAPSHEARWDGNLKRYRITSDGVIRDVANRSAVDESTGFFSTNSQSFWSDAPDGASTVAGGARSQLTDSRNVFTYTSNTSPSNTRLTLAEHSVSLDNDALTSALLGAETDEERTRYINWALGSDGDGATNEFIGDPLHSRPVVVVYGGELVTDENGNTIEEQDTTVFFGTNEGFLHAIDGNTGEETFAFIPQQLLPNLADYEEDTPGLKLYGLDGEITIIKNDLNNNGVVLDSAGNVEVVDGVKESIYLYIGMRRGGRDYFAFDITDRSQPILKWRINGGEGEFAELGQSWSRPTVGLIDVNGTPTQVLMFGGGYDPDQDNAPGRQVDSQGRSIFMVNADTGALIWSAGPNATDDLRLTGMQYGFPSRVNAIDVDGDSFTDVIFAANVGGEVWRFDLADTFTGASTFATGGRILNVTPDDTEENHRRFFVTPDVSVFSPRGEAPYFLIAIGSGARPDPLNEVTLNRFYVMREYSVFTAPTTTAGNIVYTTTTESDLFDTTNNIIQDGNETQIANAQQNLESLDGWFITLNDITEDGNANAGEKVLASSLTIGGVLFFTTFTPEINLLANQCQPTGIGVSRLFALNVLDGSAAFDQDGDDVIDRPDREVDVPLSATAGLSDLITLTLGEEPDANNPDKKPSNEQVLCIGLNCIGGLIDAETLVEDYWREDR